MDQLLLLKLITVQYWDRKQPVDDILKHSRKIDDQTFNK